VRDIKVTEHWQHYSLESEGHEETLKTDAGGLVDFPLRAIRASITARAASALANLLRREANGRSGPYASIVVWGSGDYETGVAVYTPEEPTQTDIVVYSKR
jgi:hypothetical protein